MKIQVLVFDGFDELDVVGVFEPLGMAAQDLTFASLDKQEFVIGAFGMRIVPEQTFDLERKPDLLIVPGGGWVARAAAGAWAEFNRGVILDTLKSCHRQGVTLAAVCTGAMLLAKAGLLDGRCATTNHSAVAELKETAAKYIAARVVDDGDIVTAAGVSSSLDLGLHLVERIAGKAVAADISRRLEFTPRMPIWKNGRLYN